MRHIQVTALISLALLVSACAEGIPTEPFGPTVTTFEAVPDVIEPGSSASLTWVVSQDVTSLSIDQGVGSVTGDTAVVVSPSVTTTYTLTASNAMGPVSTASATVTVTDSAPPSN